MKRQICRPFRPQLRLWSGHGNNAAQAQSWTPSPCLDPGSWIHQWVLSGSIQLLSDVPFSFLRSVTSYSAWLDLGLRTQFLTSLRLRCSLPQSEATKKWCSCCSTIGLTLRRRAETKTLSSKPPQWQAAGESCCPSQLATKTRPHMPNRMTIEMFCKVSPKHHLPSQYIHRCCYPMSSPR